MRGIVVGIDPGNTVGVAIIDLSGKLVAYKSFKHSGRSDVSHFIVSHGRPVLIATDVHPPPEFVEKITASFNAHLFSPKSVIKVEEKNRMARVIKEHIDSHTRDAFSAALLGFDHITGKIKKIDRHALDASLSNEQRERLRIRVLRGDVPHIAAGIADLKKEEELIEEIKTNASAVPIKKRKIYSLEKDYAILWNYKNHLEGIVKGLTYDVDNLKKKVSRLETGQKKDIFKDKEVRNLNNKIKSLKQDSKRAFNRFKTLQNKHKSTELELSMYKKGYVRIKGIRTAQDGDILFVNSKKELDMIKIKPKAIIGNNNSWANNIILKSDIEIISKQGFLYVSKNQLEKEIERAEKRSLENIIVNYKKRHKTSENV